MPEIVSSQQASSVTADAVLVFDLARVDDPILREALADVPGDVVIRHELAPAIRALRRRTPTLVILTFAHPASPSDPALDFAVRVREELSRSACAIVVVLTGDVVPTDALIELGIDDFVSSPLVASELAARLRLARARRTAGPTDAWGRGRFRALVQNAADLISIVEPDGTIVYSNPALPASLGIEDGEQIGYNAFDVVHPDDAPRLREAFDELNAEAGCTVWFECRMQHPDSSWRVIEASGTNLITHPAVGGIVINARDVTDRREVEQRLIHDALHDSLTGLPNRALLLDRLGQSLERTVRHSEDRCAVLFLDLDRFKMVNDSMGHVVGDQLLVEASRRLLACLRPTDTLARLGGDEFAVLLDDVHSAGLAVRVADRMQAALARPFVLRGREVFTSASIGIALGSAATGGPEDLLREADTAMYRAKAQGRAGYAIFDAAMHRQVAEQLELESDLRRAIEDWQFEVFYQPIISLHTDDVVGFEALVRWRHPRRGLVLPADFISTAEETGLINPLGQGVLEEACRQLGSWQAHDERELPLFVSVNLSTRQLTHDELVPFVAKVLAETGVARGSLVLEVTESVVMENPEGARRTLEALSELGVLISLDDFGSGYSSLRVLHEFPFDKVKLDRWFVEHVSVDRGSFELVEGVLALCHWRRLVTIAEGVETEDQRRRLSQLDCDFAQGFLFAKPLPAVAASAFLAERTHGVRSG